MTRIILNIALAFFALASFVFFGLNVNADSWNWCTATSTPNITSGLVADINGEDKLINWSRSPTIVVYEGTPYVAFEGKVTGETSTRVFFTYWNGTEWAKPINVGNMDKSYNPVATINIKTGEMHMVWSSETMSNTKIYYSRSDGFGDPWNAPILLDDLNLSTEDKALYPFIALDSDGYAHVIFYCKDCKTPNIDQVYYTTNLGGAWAISELISDVVDESKTGDVNPIYITVDKKKVPNVPTEPIFLSELLQKKGVIKLDTGPGPPCKHSCGNGKCEICYETAANCCGDCGVCPPDVIHILWKNKADGKIAHTQKNIESGALWSAIDNPDPTITKSTHPFSAADNSGGLHVTYEYEQASNKSEIFYRTLPLGGNWDTKPLSGNSNISTYSTYNSSNIDSLEPSIAVDANAAPKIAWSEEVLSQKSRIYYRQWNSDSNSWENLGQNPIWNDDLSGGSSNSGEYPFIALNYDGRPYIAWEHREPGDKSQIWMVYWGDCNITLPKPNKPPKAVCKVNPTSGDITTEFEFDAGDSNDDQTPKENLEVRWDWTNVDGVTYNTDWTTAKTAYHIFKSLGPTTTTLQVKDEKGKAGTATCTVNVGQGDVLWLYDLKAKPSIAYLDDNIVFSAYVRNQTKSAAMAELIFKITDEEGNILYTFPDINKWVPGSIGSFNPVKVFTQNYTVSLEENKNYFIHASVIYLPMGNDPEETKYLKNNERRTIFSVIKIRKVNASETSIIGIAAVMIAIIYFIERRMHYEKKRKKHHVKK